MGKDGPDSNRRVGERHFSCFPAHIKQGDEGNPRTAIIRDVSVTGAHLVTRARMAEGDSVELWLYITADTNKPRTVRGKVVRFEARKAETSDWPFSVAVHFDEALTDCESDIKELADKQAKLFGLPEDRGAKR